MYIYICIYIYIFICVLLCVCSEAVNDILILSINNNIIDLNNLFKSK